MNFEEKLKQGKVAVIECSQRIPCNPCETSCPNGAIKVGEDINNLPKIDYEKCIGCGICLRACPGLAIFLINGKDNEVTIPYEFLPLPKEGDRVMALDRQGKDLCEGEVIKVLPFPSEKKTLITLKVPSEKLMEVRNFRIKNE